MSSRCRTCSGSTSRRMSGSIRDNGTTTSETATRNEAISPTQELCRGVETSVKLVYPSAEPPVDLTVGGAALSLRLVLAHYFNHNHL